MTWGREQLSLYVPSELAASIEEVRRALDPVQHALIPAHVTLLRDEEMVGLSEARVEEALVGARAVTLRFGGPEIFLGHGVLMPGVGGLADFVGLRARLVGEEAARRQTPHITLAHPRNPKTSGDLLRKADSLRGGMVVTFSAVQHIRQELGRSWEVVRGFGLQEGQGVGVGTSVLGGGG